MGFLSLMGGEQLSTFDPVGEAARLIRKDLSGWGWSGDDLDQAQKLMTEHAETIKGVRAEIRYIPRRGKTPPGKVKPRVRTTKDLGVTLLASIQKFKAELHEAKVDWDYDRLAGLEQRKAEARRREAEREALQRPVHLVGGLIILSQT